MRFRNLKSTKPGVLNLKSEVKIGLRGMMGWELVDAKTGEVKQSSPMQPNLIVDGGLDQIMGSNSTLLTLFFSDSVGGAAAVGTGAVAPANGDTSLGSEIVTGGRTRNKGGIADTTAHVSSSPTHTWRRRTFEFSESQGNGNLTEFGIFSAITSGTLMVRTLFKDSGGTPTAVTKTSAEKLRVFWELQIFSPEADVTQSSFAITGNEGFSCDVTTRVALSGGSSSWGGALLTQFGVWDTLPSLGSVQATVLESNTLSDRTTTPSVSGGVTHSSGSVAAYSNGNYFRDVTFVWGTSVANSFASGIGLVLFTACVTQGLGYNAATQSMWQQSFSTSFDKTNLKQLTLTQRITISRV